MELIKQVIKFFIGTMLNKNFTHDRQSVISKEGTNNFRHVQNNQKQE